jgi:orotate phosphoribosyltransferase
VHPLQALLGASTSLPFLDARIGVEYPVNDRTFHGDRFTVPTVPGGRVLLLDDTWTTGARAQSLCHALKASGAQSVVIVVLGRHLNGGHDGSKSLVQRARATEFDISSCALDG